MKTIDAMRAVPPAASAGTLDELIPSDPAAVRGTAAEGYGGGRVICFVCTGNTCRSPMAAAVFNHLAREAADAEAWLSGPCSGDCDACGRCGHDAEGGTDEAANHPRAVSAGLGAFDGDPISENAVRALEEAGIPSTPDNDYLHHTARQAAPALLSACDLIVGITKGHAMRLLFACPELASRITSLPSDIPDPWGGSLSDYEACLAALTDCIRNMFFSD